MLDRSTRGIFVTQVGRVPDTAELLCLQGLDTAEMTTTGLSPAKVGHLMGGAFTQTVVQCILFDLLPRARIVRNDNLRDMFAA